MPLRRLRDCRGVACVLVQMYCAISCVAGGSVYDALLLVRLVDVDSVASVAGRIGNGMSQRT